MSKYPWGEISSNSKPGEYAARSVDSEGAYPWLDMSWGISPSGNAALLVGYSKNEWQPSPLPQFSNIKVQDSKSDHVLAIELVDASSLDMFFHICLDIIQAARNASPSQTRLTCLYRLDRWSSLLRRQPQILSEEEQKGLIAELLTLKDCILLAIDETSAIQGWTGPDGETQDFNYGQVAIEVKSKRKTSQPHVLISSETQLAASSEEDLFLRVLELNREANGKGFTLDDVVKETREQISDPLQTARFDSKLASAGYFDDDFYEAFSWSLGSIYVYRITSDFPRITKSDLPYGVDKVSYRLDLDYCAEFLSDDQAIRSALRSDNE